MRNVTREKNNAKIKKLRANKYIINVEKIIKSIILKLNEI